MRVVVQRVTKASLTVDKELVSSIGRGIVVLTGLQHTDTQADLKWMCNKILNLRLWEADGKTWNKSVKAKDYEVLLVSQFTLYGTLQRGNKPDFHLAMEPEKARELYSSWVKLVQTEYETSKVKDGKFGAMMQVELTNDGPVTFEITTDDVNIPGRKPHPNTNSNVNKTNGTEASTKPQPSAEAQTGFGTFDVDSVSKDKIPVLMKRLQKKIVSAQALKSRFERGHTLTPEQHLKLESEARLLEQFASLKQRLE